MTMFIALRGSRRVLLATDGFRRSNRQEVMSALAKHGIQAARRDLNRAPVSMKSWKKSAKIFLPTGNVW